MLLGKRGKACCGFDANVSSSRYCAALLPVEVVMDFFGLLFEL